MTGTGAAIASGIQIKSGKPADSLYGATYVFGGVNLAMAGLLTYVATQQPAGTFRDVFAGVAAAHFTIATADIVLPSIGLSHGRKPAAFALPAPHIAPVVVGGFDAGGRPWGGVGLRLASF